MKVPQDCDRGDAGDGSGSDAGDSSSGGGGGSGSGTPQGGSGGEKGACGHAMVAIATVNTEALFQWAQSVSQAAAGFDLQQLCALPEAQTRVLRDFRNAAVNYRWAGCMYVSLTSESIHTCTHVCTRLNTHIRTLTHT